MSVALPSSALAGPPPPTSDDPVLATPPPPAPPTEPVLQLFQRCFPTIHYQPLTVKGLKEGYPELLCIYTDATGQPLVFTPIAEKVGGTAIGTIYRLGQGALKCLGKINTGTGRVARQDSYRTYTKQEINVAAILEMLAYNWYRQCALGFFLVPKAFLSNEKVLDPFTEQNDLAQAVAQRLYREPDGDLKNVSCLRILTEFVEGYQDFSKAKTRLPNGEEIFFVDYVARFHTLPEEILTSDGHLVPLLGGIELVAAIRVAGDTDGFGGRFMNAGFIWEFSAQGILIAARAVKIDPGEAFRFDAEDADSINMLRRTRETRVERRGNPDYHLLDQRDIQTANQDPKMTIYWKDLTENQKVRFLSILINALRYRHNPEVLSFLLGKNRPFYRNDLEQLPP